MNKLKLFGICIGVLIALTLVNAVTLDELLNSYDRSFDDGGFTADFTGFSRIWASNSVAGMESGRNIFNFTIGGTDSSGQYTVVATLNVIRNGVFNNENIIIEKNQTGSGIATFNFDGSYYFCHPAGQSTTTPVTFDIELRIFKNQALRYQKVFEQDAVCSVYPVYFSYTDAKTLDAIDTSDPDSLNDYVNVSLHFFFRENRTYKIGAYIWDNKSATVYAEKSIRPTTSNDFFFGVPLPLIYNASLLKDFELKNEKILLKSISIDGHIIRYGSFINGYNQKPSSKFNTSNFERDEILITNVSFNKTTSNGKVKELGVKVNAANVIPGVYRIELSLENQFGEVIKVINRTTGFAGNTETLWFNGTEIYNSKVNGPYRVGFLRITKLGNKLAYKLDSAVSNDLQYINFTLPLMSDLKINNSDVTGNNKDINITVYNIGSGDAAGITISLFDGNANKVKEIIVSSINASANYFYSFKNVNLTHAFIFIDFNNLVEETNESNNIAEFTLQGIGIQPARIISRQPNQNSLTMTDSQTNQFNVTVNGTLPINYKWYINNGSLFRLVSTANNFIFSPNYYDEGIRTLKINVSNSNGSDQRSWNVNVTPNKIAVYAYVYHKNQYLIGNKTTINSNISFDGAVKSSASPVKINLTVDSVHNVTYSSSGFKPFTTKFYFDRRLFTCKENQNCALTNTNCVWDTTNNDNWVCTVTNGATTDYFRMYTNPKRIKINAYLAVNST